MCRAIAMEPEISEYEAKGINAFRCMATSMFENIANLLLAYYYYLKEHGEEEYWQHELNFAMPYICTCNVEIDKFGDYIMGESEKDAEDSNAKYIGVCSEKAYEKLHHNSTNSTNTTSNS